MAYTKYYPAGWVNGSQGGTPVTKPALDNMDQGIADAHADIAQRVVKGSTVFNVRDYGAVGDWSTGTTGTDDTPAINAALAAAAAVGSAEAPARVLVPWTTGNGYKFTAAIVTPQNVEWDCRSDLVYCGAGGEDALTVGTVTQARRRWHRVRLRKHTLSSWASESDRGLVIRNHFLSTFEIITADYFTVGVTCIGDNGGGFGYNKLFIGSITDNKIGLDLTNDTAGWCNENKFFGGRFACSSGTYTSLDRIGVRVTSRATTKYYNNSNTFYGPCFELKGAVIAGSSRCVLVEYGTAHKFHDCRHESNSPEVLEQKNDSHSNEMTFAYSDLGPTLRPVIVNGSTSSSAMVRLQYEQMIDSAKRVIYRADALHKKACYYDGNTSVNIPGLTVGTSATGNTDARAASSITLAANYVELGVGRYAGFYMSTRNLERFCVFRDCESGYGGRVIIRAYDSSGTILSAAGTVKTTSRSGAPLYATSYGGAWRMGSDSGQPYDFQVSSATDYVFIGVTDGTAACRIRSLTVATADQDDAATWLAFADDGQGYATTPPTAGTWAAGRILRNAAPAPGSPLLWVCTTGGTPGTWTSVYAGAVAPASDVQVFTASGTWTRPSTSAYSTTRVICIGSGAGGGSGRRGAAGTVRCGGSVVARSELVVPTASLPSTVAVTVGPAGAGGAAVTANDTNGNNGAAGAAVTFGSYCRGGGGGAGGGGTNAAGTSGSGGVGGASGGSGAAASVTGGAGTASSAATSGGAGGASGGGVTSGDSASNGGAGVMATVSGSSTYAGGVVDTTSPVAAGAGLFGSAYPGASGGGGAASITAAAQAGQGGGIYGAGGSGGGAALNGFSSGAGGDGAAGICVAIST